MWYKIAIVFLLIAFSAGCKQIQSEPAILFDTIAISRQTYIYEKPQLRSARVDQLREGELVHVLQEPKNRWMQVKIPSGKVGWVETRDLLRQEYYDEWQKLNIQTKNQPVQMKAETGEEAYLRLRPGRDTIKVYKMVGSKQVDVVAIAHTERPGTGPKPGDKPKAKPVPPPPAKNGKDGKGKKVRRNSDNETKYDTWFLVRTAEGNVGWIYSGLVVLHIPEELARYAESKIIVAWRVLRVSKDADGSEHPWYLSIERDENSDEDFDRIRVLYWNSAKKRYELLYRIQNVVGIFPVDSKQVDPGQPGLPRFTIRHLDEENPNQIIVDEYEINGTQTKRINTTIESA